MKTFNKLCRLQLFMLLLFAGMMMSSCETEDYVQPLQENALEKNQVELSNAREKTQLELPAGIPSAEFMKQMDTQIIDRSALRDRPEVPELSDRNKATGDLRNGCLEYNKWNWTSAIGWIYPFSPTDNWVYSWTYMDYVYLDKHSDACNSAGFIFHTYWNEICGHFGWLWDNSVDNNTLWFWDGSNWSSRSCSRCENNDFTSRFINYVNNYTYLKGEASCCGAANFVSDLNFFKNLIQTDAPLDVKNSDWFLSNLHDNCSGTGIKLFGREVAADVPGNILYGFIGHLYWENKYPNDTDLFLTAAAGLAQGISDGKLNGTPWTQGLLAFPDEWLCLTSYDPWCDTYAISFGVRTAEQYGPNISDTQWSNRVNASNTWLLDGQNSCPALYSPTGYTDCEYP